ncbi:HNH endonuclease family protein [Kitasatospora sp. NPDC001547]|uniref:HNH endonuclease family protein n=1 Tax=Kitasatospora sp. NPDC001547 TaxID=3364015 RepID=UPI0036BFB327|nr:hypothetical protein KitaXyl93_06060 [Kitasatospora sp. Xyl93]
MASNDILLPSTPSFSDREMAVRHLYGSRNRQHRPPTVVNKGRPEHRRAPHWMADRQGWSPKERERYGNDLRDPRALLAVSAKTNRSKSDKDPADWMPPVGDFACTYVSDWVVVKTRWGLSIDQREADALHRIAAGCEDTKLQVVLAR